MENNNSCIQYLTHSNIPFETNVSLSKKTWIKTGGMCACWIIPNSFQQLRDVCTYLYQNNMTFDLVGQTSNIFFHSTYNPEIVVSTVKVNQYDINDDIIICDCGVNVVKLAKDCLSKGYAGFSGLAGLPGTVASAIVNNAGCFNCSLSSMLISADVLLPDGTVRTLPKEDFRYSHRSSVFKRGELKGIILSVRLKAEKAVNIEREHKKAEASANYRRYKQEGYSRNLGSVFASRKMRKNARNYIAVGLSRMMSLFRLVPQRKALKRLLLWLYGYQDLSLYLSDKNVNTYVWRDERAEPLFARYKQFVNEVFTHAVIEIEEKE